MRTPASIAGHPIHPMLVPIAIGGFILSFVFDIVCMITGAREPWATVAYFTMIGGFVGALCAALPGLVDMLSLQGYTKKVALMHMGLNLTVVALYACNIWMRHNNVETSTPIVLSALALGLLVISGWLGGKMVYEAGVGVDTAGAVDTSTTARPTGGRHINA
jgi:uncharacterized membrane protein